MQIKREIEYGKITSYDGYDGNIKGLDGNDYILKNTDIVGNQKLYPEDHVVFEKETIHNLEIEDIKIARFVKKLKK